MANEEGKACTANHERLRYGMWYVRSQSARASASVLWKEAV